MKPAAVAILFIAITTVTSSCTLFRKPGNLGTYAVCRATGDSSACLSGWDIARQAQRTGYWDLTLNFPEVVDGVGTIVTLSEAYGLRRIGNISPCLPSIRKAITHVPVVRTGTWSDYQGFKLRPADFVRLENAGALGDKFDQLNSINAHIDSGDIDEEVIDALDILKVIRSGLTDLNAVCRTLLLPEAYVVTNALTIRRVGYRFHTVTGEVDLDPNSIRSYLKLDESSQYSFASNGRLIRESPIYVAVKSVRRLDHLGDSGSDDTATFNGILTSYCRQLRSCVQY